MEKINNFSEIKTAEEINGNDSATNVKQVVDLALEAGRILLKNGGEIFRVEETITRICHHYGVTKVDIFTLSHGLFVSAENEKGDAYTRVQHIPLSGAHLGIVAEVNQLSRQIAQGGVEIPEAVERLKEIDQIRPLPWGFQLLGAGLGSAGFGFLMGASVTESLVTFFIGAIVYGWVLLAKKVHLTKIIVNMFGGIMISILAIFAQNICISEDLQIHGMIIGAIMPLIPGLAFTNAIRDIADSDFLSGTVRMMDAILVFIYIAIGVGFVLAVYNNIGGLLL